MRTGLIFLIAIALSLLASRTNAHLADEFPQVVLQLKIAPDAVELTARIPAKDATFDVFDGLSPIAMDQMEPEHLAEMIGPVLARRCIVMIDGVVVPPNVSGAMMRMTQSRQPVRRFPQAQALEQGLLQFIARYETKAPPRSVSLDWSIYANQYDENRQPIHAPEDLQVVAIIDVDQRQEIAVLMPNQPRYSWSTADAALAGHSLRAPTLIERDKLILPALSLVFWLAGILVPVLVFRQSWIKAGLCFACLGVLGGVTLPVGHIRFKEEPSYEAISDEQALAVFETLHRNIYRAFDYNDEGAIYDALAQSVSGSMLDTIYHDVYQSLVMQEHDNAVSKVVRVDMQDMKRLPAEQPNNTPNHAQYRVQCAWQVQGLVTHYGHTHARTHAFKALYTVSATDNAWRITDAEILDQRRIDDGTQTIKDLYPKP